MALPEICRRCEKLDAVFEDGTCANCHEKAEEKIGPEQSGEKEGCEMSRKTWTNEEDAVLREEWGKGRGAAKRAAARPSGRSTIQCTYRASRIGCAAKRGKRDLPDGGKPEGNKAKASLPTMGGGAVPVEVCAAVKRVLAAILPASAVREITLDDCRVFQIDPGVREQLNGRVLILDATGAVSVGRLVLAAFEGDQTPPPAAN